MPLYTSEISVDNTPLPVDGSGVTQPVSGTVAVSNFPATQPVSGPLTDTQLRATPVPVSGPLTDTQLRATPVPVSGTVAVSNFPGSSVGSAVVTTVAVGVSAIQLLASRAARVRAVIFNEAGTLYVKAGAAASSSDYTWRLTANTELDVTQYYGVLTAAKQSGTTDVHVTDF